MQTVNILALGDVFALPGCDAVRNRLAALKKHYHIDAVIANGENSAEGNGVLPSSANHLFDSGVDVITTGNHALRRREIFDYMSEHPALVRPANFHRSAPGSGVFILDRLKWKLGVINLQGAVYLDQIQNPFDIVDELLAEAKAAGAAMIVIDFHAEATAEKQALAHYIDGRASAIFGTHTHVQTADERVFPGGTGYISDLGMCGVVHSVLGVRPDLAIKRLSTNLPTRFETAQGETAVQGCVFSLDPASGKCVGIERVNVG